VQRVVLHRRGKDPDDLHRDVLSTAGARRTELAAVRRQLAAAGRHRPNAAAARVRRSSMNRVVLIGIVLASALLAPAGGFAQVSCSRDGLQRAVALYVAAQTKGDTSGLPLATGLGYRENNAPANIADGLIKTAMKIDHHRSLLDPATCQTFTEVIVTNKD